MSNGMPPAQTSCNQQQVPTIPDARRIAYSADGFKVPDAEEDQRDASAYNIRAREGISAAADHASMSRDRRMITPRRHSLAPCNSVRSLHSFFRQASAVDSEVALQGTSVRCGAVGGSVPGSEAGGEGPCGCMVYICPLHSFQL